MKPCDQENYYHDPETIVDTPEVVVKICRRCKVEMVCTKDPKGRVDNETFHRFHRRNYLQPSHRHFEREFGKPKALRYNEEKMRETQKHNELEEQAEEEALYGERRML